MLSFASSAAVWDDELDAVAAIAAAAAVAAAVDDDDDDDDDDGIIGIETVSDSEVFSIPVPQWTALSHSLAADETAEIATEIELIEERVEFSLELEPPEALSKLLPPNSKSEFASDSPDKDAAANADFLFSFGTDALAEETAAVVEALALALAEE